MEPKHRLQQARRDAGFDTPSDAARALRDLNRNTLISHENGNRSISRTAAEKYGKLFGVNPGWILYGRSETRVEGGTQQVPVLSLISASNLRDQPGVTEADIQRWISVADLPAEGDWFALEVDGDSMDRVAPDGATILVNRADATLLDKRFYVFALESGAATFKQYRRKPDRLQPYSTNPEHFSIPASDDLYVIGRVRRVIHDI